MQPAPPIAGPGMAGPEPIRGRTLVALRWVALGGQLAAVIAAWAIGARFPVLPVMSLIAMGAVVNLWVRGLSGAITDDRALMQLGFDALQIGALLTLTGGTENPFAPLMLVPVTIGATTLPGRATAALAAVTLAMVSLAAMAPLPLTFAADPPVDPVRALRFGRWLGLVIGGGFFAVYAHRVSTELGATSDALAATQMALAREQRLQHLGGIVAAAAHEMGTPLATIKLVGAELAEELAQELPDRTDIAEDLALLRSSADRCRDILRSMGNAGKDDLHMHVAPLDEILAEAAAPHRDRGKTIVIEPSPASTLDFTRDPGIVYALRNLIQNGVDFARTTVTISSGLVDDKVRVTVRDDGAGFPAQVLNRLGDPFVTSRRATDRQARSYEGMGLGVFIARTLLARSGARVAFSNDHGARVDIAWPVARVAVDGRAALGQNPTISA